MGDAKLLSSVRTLAELPGNLLEQLATESEHVHLTSGEWLFRAGDPADSLFVIRSGRLEVLADDHSEARIRILKRGQTLGELALLTGGTRTASVRAVRDSELIELGRDHFESLLRDEPAFAVGLTGALGAQLAASRAPSHEAVPPRVVSVLRVDPAAPTEFAEMLGGELARHGSVAMLTKDQAGSRAQWNQSLDRAERSTDRVLLVGDGSDSESEWNDFCARETDLVVALTSGRPAPAWLARNDILRDSELVSTGLADSELARSAPRNTTVAGSDRLGAAAGSLARRLSGKAVGVVLSGGGARAFAHLGAMEELIHSGLTIDRIAGVSMGSVVAAGIALGKTPEELSKEFDEGFVKENPTRDYTLPLFSLIRGRRAERLLRGLLGEARIEELAIRYFSLSCDLISRQKVIHRYGPLFEAVRASLSIPGIFPPVKTVDGRLLVDGGVLDNLPVSTMAADAEGPIIAIDVTGKMGGTLRAPRPRLAGLEQTARRFLTGREYELPRLPETIMRTLTVGSIDTVVEARKHADLLIQPEVEGCGMLEWGQLESVREAGRQAVLAELESVARVAGG